MKYTSEQINKMSWQEWNETMAEELNQKGFKTKEFNSDEHRWEKTGKYKAGDDPRFFVLGTIEDSDAISYLKNVGLLNNGRCPMCGAPINNNPGRFTSGYDQSYHFQICQNCAKSRGGLKKRTSMSESGCIVAQILIPWYLLKNIF